MKRIATAWLAALGFLLLVATLPTYAQPAGRDYVTIDPPLNSDSPGKIEVIEFFSFACPHCNDLQPLLNTWETKLPRDVVFKRVPVVFNPFYQLMAKLYYALEITGDLARLDGAVFNAIHAKGLRLVDEKSITEWVTSQGVDARKFSDAWNSFALNTKVSRGNQLAQSARINGVPAIMIDGRYLVDGRNPKDMLAMTDKVINKRRAEIGPKKK